MAAFTAAAIAASVAASAYAAHKQSDAAKEAAATQAASGDKALALQKEMYEKNSQLLSPWVNTGAQANATLGGLMGLGTGSGGTAAPATPMATVPAAAGKASLADYYRAKPADAPVVGTAVPRARPPMPVQSPAADALNPASTMAQTRSSYVRMKAPTGEIGDIPEAAVPHFTQLGATVVA